MDGLGFDLNGVESVVNKLELLGNPKLAKKLSARSARKAMTLVKNAGVANASLIDDFETSEQISKNIVVRAGKSKDRNSVRMRVGVKGGTEFWRIHKNMVRKNNTSGENERVPNPYYTPVPNNTSYWWHVELGTSYSMAIPFLRPALDNNIDVVTRTFSVDFMAGIDEELRKI
ncbi:hypothetical protein MMO38_05335 [Acinetobacter sp. NIPH 1852]|uniref:HK97-gp10 family putative phage morphogenesis protein n=1 Tax=Acinetobacter sp. NIPH 1852 TaxID=2923428 RepID=UPI001F4B444F|nr:HK97-gp10 family putative phage morphogenesis protein [Acinetobacter sp. NIPH 1852]MCH7307569.1 hypothetical protein [Acinetobacter sp. NIPH 1852]